MPILDTRALSAKVTGLNGLGTTEERVTYGGALHPRDDQQDYPDAASKIREQAIGKVRHTGVGNCSRVIRKEIQVFKGKIKQFYSNLPFISLPGLPKTYLCAQ